jgi:hypothetical protein
VARQGERIPGDVEPGGAGEELVGEGVGFEEVDEALELDRIFRADVGGLAEKMLGILDAPYPAIDGLQRKPELIMIGPTMSRAGSSSR